MQSFRDFRRRDDGNISILAGVMIIFLIGVVGVIIDYQYRNKLRADLQDIADTLATRGAREFLLANARGSDIESLVRALVPSFYERAGRTFGSTIRVTADDAEVSVKLVAAAPKSFFLNSLPALRADIVVDATAAALGGVNVCVISLDESAARAVSAIATAQLVAPGCSILANSTSSRAVSSTGLARLSANLICSSGGYEGPSSNFNPTPVTDCPVYPDPLAEREPPATGACDHVDLQIEARVNGGPGGRAGADALLLNDAYSLQPGVYCGGLTIGGGVSVTLSPGIYVMKDGPLVTEPLSALSGQNVTIYLQGDASTFLFRPESHVSLTAARDGITAGLLFFEDRDAPLDRRHRIMSDDARTLLGTFYLPRGILEVTTAMPVADQSAYTAIVARRINLTGGPTLVLNSDYALTDIPVPDGIGPVGGTVLLRE